MLTGLFFELQMTCQSLKIIGFVYGLLSLTDLTTNVGPKP